MQTTIEKEEIKKFDPISDDVFASPKASARYTLLKTADVIKEMGERGWKSQSIALPGKNQFGFHRVTFVPEVTKEFDNRLGSLGLVPTLEFFNSYDARHSARAFLGIHRQVCSNGLVMKVAQNDSKAVHHASVTEWAKGMVNMADRHQEKLIETVSFASSNMASQEFKEQLVNQMIAMRGFNIERLRLNDPLELLMPKREADIGNDMWKVFNVAQEVAIRGGEKVLTDQKRILKINVELWETLKVEIDRLQRMN